MQTLLTFLGSRTVRAILVSGVLMIVRALAGEHLVPIDPEQVDLAIQGAILLGLWYSRFPKATVK